MPLPPTPATTALDRGAGVIALTKQRVNAAEVGSCQCRPTGEIRCSGNASQAASQSPPAWTAVNKSRGTESTQGSQPPARAGCDIRPISLLDSYVAASTSVEDYALSVLHFSTEATFKTSGGGAVTVPVQKCFVRLKCTKFIFFGRRLRRSPDPLIDWGWIYHLAIQRLRRVDLFPRWKIFLRA